MHSWLAVVVVILLGARQTAGEVVTLTPIADAFLSAQAPNSNYGGAGALAVSSASFSKGEFDSLLRFNLALTRASFDAIYGAGLWQIDSIDLQLTAGNPNNSIFNGAGEGPNGTNVNYVGLFSVKWMAADDWIEGTGTTGLPASHGVTYADLAGLEGPTDALLGTFGFPSGISGSFNSRLALTPAFLADAITDDLASFLVLPADENVSFVFNSRGFGAAASRPALTITASAIPEPASAGLVATACVIGLGCRRRSEWR